MEKENLTPGQFSEVVGIQRSAVSHLVTGRNKPSLEVIQKILNTFRTINSDWLILGVGSMYRGEKQGYQPSLFDQIDEKADEKEVVITSKSEKNVDANTSKEIEQVKNLEIAMNAVQNMTNAKPKLVNKIIVYYSDSTFEEFKKNPLE